MSVFVTLEGAIKPGKSDELLMLLEKYLPQTKQYKGFESISIHFEKTANNVIFFQKWRSVQHYESYLAWRTETGVMGRLGEVFLSRPTIRYFDNASLQVD